MLAGRNPSVILAGVVLALIAVASLSTFLVRQKRSQPSNTNDIAGGVRNEKLYEDEDGVATNESQQEYSAAISRYTIVLVSFIGCLISLSLSVYSTIHPGCNLFPESWMAFGSWVLLTIQGLNLFVEHDCSKRFDLGIYEACATLLLLLVIAIENGLTNLPRSSRVLSTVHIVLTSVEAALAVCLFVACLALPRRPSVAKDGQPVDDQFTVSALNRYTFTWAGKILRFARTNKGLDLTDLPNLAYHSRSEILQKEFLSKKQNDRLWKSVLKVHAPALIQQWILTIIQAFAQFVPQFAMYNLLQLLEQRSEGASVATVAWAWVVGLGISMIISSWIEAWLFWIVWSTLGLPIRAELSALIFSKSMRRKDVKGVGKAKGLALDETNRDSTLLMTDASGTKGEDTVPKPTEDDKVEEDEGIQKSRQSTINLVGVDAKRVADMMAYNYFYPGVVAKLVASMWFLSSLIGWPSLLAGLAVSALSTPLNIYTSKAYNSAQGDLMKYRDQKMVVVTEALQGIRQIKFSAIERQWQEKISAKRSDELRTQRRVFRLDTVLISIWILGPVMLSAVSLAVYSILKGDLSPSIAFTAIAVFGQIESTLAILPELTTELLDAWVSINRIEEYLNAPEKPDNMIPADEIRFEKVSVAWPADSQEDDPDRFILRDLNIKFPNKELSVIYGKTGSGKSLLLASILGEVDKIDGVMKVPRAPPTQERIDHLAHKGNWIIDSAIAFVAQIPWIENATIKDNVLFGMPCDAGRYRKVLAACALEKDLDMLPDGEMTDIGANGINLSGGQRWRVSFARALYSRAGILVLDDIFSAVDAHVGRKLFEEALTGELGEGRTRILVTHHVNLCLSRAKYAVILGEGTVEHAGSVEELQKRGKLEKILKEEEEQPEKQDESDGLIGDEVDGNTLKKVFSRRSERTVKIDDSELDGHGKLNPKKFTEDEKRETGSIKFGIYIEYFGTSGGILFWGLLIFLYAGYMGLIMGRSWWISLWTRSYQTESAFMQQSIFQFNHYQSQAVVTAQTNQNTDLWYYLGVYIGLSVVICVIGTLRYYFTFIGSLQASRVLFDNLTKRVLRAPLRWLDTVPVGRILNRFTADFNIIDSRMANDLGFGIYQLMQLLGIIIAGLFVSLYMILFAVVLLSICLYVALRYLAGAREVKRLESNAKSPIFEQFGSALAGVGTIRAFGKADEYVHRMFNRVDNHTRTFWYLWLFNRWMGFRLNIVGAVFAILVAAVIVSAKGIDASLAGFALGFALQYTTAIVWTLRSYANAELDMNATERIIEYTRIEIEDQGGMDAPAAWPTEGRLEVDNLVAGYAPDLPPVLKGLSFRVEKTHRIGVVGRTGAGKSSLTLALFRFLEAREGSIVIDGIDISKIKLHDLRSRLAIIPQDPVLFSGTIRSNLDAFDEHSDEELYDALERVHLIQDTSPPSRAEPSGSGKSISTAAIDTNTNIFNSLASRISEGGLNLSQGQRQLLCLARAIVSRPKIMVLDEATSAVDMATDVLIQRSIREQFDDSTLIVIAHRLSTIADFDRILVMSEGMAVEYDEPKKLMEKKGVFWDMIGSSGEKEKLENIILGKDNGKK